MSEVVPFLVMTVLLGGGAAWMTGRAVARGWRPLWTLVLYVVLLSFAVRFLHYAFGDSGLLDAGHWLADLAVLATIAAIAFRFTRAGQMARQYFWLYKRTSPLTWTVRS